MLSCLQLSSVEGRRGDAPGMGVVLELWSTAPARQGGGAGAWATQGPETQPGPAGLLGS